MKQLTAGLGLALAVSLIAFAGQAAALVAPALGPSCAPDAGRYGWTVDLQPAANQTIEMSWGVPFTTFQTTDFGSAGAHGFTTPRGGTDLVIRYASDHGAAASATASGALCGSAERGAVTPIVELPGGSDQRSPNAGQAVLGVQTAPASSVQRLPSTSTDNGPSFPLAGLGLAITALGGALLRRGNTPV